MSLAARIVLAPSRRLAVVTAALPPLGLIVATVALIARWPSAAIAFVAASILLAGLFADVERRRVRRIRPITLGVADRAGVDLRFGREAATEDSWRLVDSTVAWPGFAMLALSLDAWPAAVLRRPVLMSELPFEDRRALARFLLWTLRNRGGGPGPEESPRR